MLSITVSTKKIMEQSASLLALFVRQDMLDAPCVQQVHAAFDPVLSASIKEKEFVGKAGSTCSAVGVHNGSLVRCVLVGLGTAQKNNKVDVEVLRRAVGKAIRAAECHKNTSVALVLPDAALFGVTESELAQQVATIVHMAGYHFDDYLTDKASKKSTVQEVVLVTDVAHKDAVQRGVDAGSVIAAAVNKARHWIDLPPQTLTPPQLAQKAQEIADKHGLSIKTFSEPEIIQMGMGGLAGVSRGSELDCQLVILEYKAPSADAPTIGFVGKGITFDSGGLSLKPAQYMETMKEDMSGAAAVIASMEALAQLKPNVNIVALAPLSENLPGGIAVKPGDILTFYNGKTAEVKNTDAEGRLVLADALSYAVQHYKLDALIDLATLTGACAYALGPFFTGMMSQHDDFAKKVQQAADQSGDRVWALPFNDDYKPAIKSQVADISNIGSKRYMAGAVTAGFFLQNFVDDTPWVHLDIAGTAFDVPDISYYRAESATGVGVRLLVSLAMEWGK